MTKTGTVYAKAFRSFEQSLPPLLSAAELDRELTKNGARTILIKPNLVEALAPPITTPVNLIENLVMYLQKITDTPIIIGEGCGAMHYETRHSFEELGYTDLSARLGIELIDLNDAELVRLKKNCRRWPEMYLPRIALESFLISVPVLKAHSIAGVTLTMKNMMGLVPPSHYRQGNSWKKSAFHHRIQDAVADLNRYRTPDFTVLDASVGMAEAHLWGPACDPPVNILAAGYDPVAIDSYGSSLLHRKWQNIGHIRTLNGELGIAEPLDIIQV
ncbi:MAG: DUF362 domain-containing protein [Desulfobulbaceae bacterium]|nr:DUF362 domain-containing protein [Desulfobulbaceae bacterium]